MIRLELAPEVFEDFDRILNHLLSLQADDPAGRIAGVIDALQLLTHSPLIGRQLRGGKRELVIGQGVRGYVALYRYLPQLEVIYVLAVRSQRELGYKHDF